MSTAFRSATFVVVLFLLGCQSTEQRPNLYQNQGLDLRFKLDPTVHAKYSHQVTVTNHGKDSVRYMALTGFENQPAYIEQINAGGSVRIIEHSIGELMQNYTIGANEAITFVVNIHDYTLKMGFPVYDGQFNQQVFWFYIKS